MNRYHSTVYTYSVFTFTFVMVFCFIVYPLMGLENKRPATTYTVVSNPEFKFIQVSSTEESKLSKDADFWNRVHWIESKRGKYKYQYDQRLGYKPKTAI